MRRGRCGGFMRGAGLLVLGAAIVEQVVASFRPRGIVSGDEANAAATASAAGNAVEDPGLEGLELVGGEIDPHEIRGYLQRRFTRSGRRYVVAWCPEHIVRGRRLKGEIVEVREWNEAALFAHGCSFDGCCVEWEDQGEDGLGVNRAIVDSVKMACFDSEE